MKLQHIDIFQRMLSGEAIPFNDPHYHLIREACDETRKLLIRLNNEANAGEIRKLLSSITAAEIDKSTTLFPPLYINYGKNTRIGKNVFINFDCTFLDLGGITIEDNVMIAPKVCLSSEGHPVSAKDRQKLTTGKIVIKKNAWIGANSTILPGVTIGINSIIAAGAVVNKDVPDHTVVAGIPSKIIQTI